MKLYLNHIQKSNIIQVIIMGIVTLTMIRVYPVVKRLTVLIVRSKRIKMIL